LFSADWADKGGVRQQRMDDGLHGQRRPRGGNQIDANIKTVDAVLAKYSRRDGSFETYDKPTEADRLTFKGPVRELAEDLSRLRGTLGLS
jgi:iron uptake system EfeUOB component EfeO/EfeM